MAHHATKLHKQTLVLDNKLVEYRVVINGTLIGFFSGENIHNEILSLLENGFKDKDITIRVKTVVDI